MVNDPSPSPWHGSTESTGTEPPRPSFFRSRWQKHENKIGLLPAVGWQQRNLQFLGEILLPTLLSPRQPRREGREVPCTARHEIGITWLGHASFLVQMEGVNILIDPNWALWHGPVKRLRHPTLYAHDMPPIDLVLITHAHFDHLHLPSLRRIANGQPIILPRGVGSIVRRCGFSDIIELDTWQTARFRDLRITLTPARHWGARLIHDTHRQFGGFLIQSATRTAYHCGDSALFDGFIEIGKRADIEIALLPIGAYEAPSGRPVHMNPEEAITAFQMLRAVNMIPMHHDTFPLSGEPIAEPLERLRRASTQLGLDECIHVLPEGHSAIY
jgi:L-ascorbate metabolism protein UlaG (beta-lactamase superfamily)